MKAYQVLLSFPNDYCNENVVFYGLNDRFYTFTEVERIPMAWLEESYHN